MDSTILSIDKDDCIRCGSCTVACSTGALTLNTETYELNYNESKCIDCGECILACPLRAIKKVS